MDMVSGLFAKHLVPLVRAGRASEADVDSAVRRVLLLKERLGLFEQPYVDLQREKNAASRPGPTARAALRAARADKHCIA